MRPGYRQQEVFQSLGAKLGGQIFEHVAQRQQRLQLYRRQIGQTFHAESCGSI
jgi:hypothetical protein